MFAKKSDNEPDLNVPINKLLTQMNAFSGEDKEYAQMVDQLTKLYDMKQLEKTSTVSAETLAIIAGNLIAVILIVGHERANVVTSKALTFVQKLR